jgi:hypothetical protein
MSGLVQFLVNVIALLAAGAIFFLSIDRVAPDAFFAKISKIAVGALLLIALIVSVAGALGFGGGGTAISPLGIIYFAIAVIIAVVVLFVVNLVIDWIATQMGEGGWVVAVKYIIAAIVLIGLLVAAANMLFGYKVPFRVGAASATSTGYMSELLGG